MPDQMTDEQIEVLFAELRADTMTQLRPPGTGAARHTVRHRRAVRSVAAGAAVLAVAGGVVVAGHSGLITGRTGFASERSTLEFLSEQAATVVGLAPQTPDRSAYPLSGRGPVEQHSIRSHQVLSGTYMITMSCAGEGDSGLDVAVRSGAAPATGDHRPETVPVVWRDSLLCRPASTIVRTISILVPSNGMFAVEVQPDASTAGRVGFAYRARLGSTDQQAFTGKVQQQVVGTSAGTAVAQLSQFLDDAIDRQHNAVLPGPYHIRMSCVGAGSVDVSVREYPDADATDPLGGERTLLRRLTCGTAAAVEQADFVKSSTGALVIWLQPDEDARGQAAASFRLDAG